MKVIDLTGQKFSRLSVLERAPNNKRGQAHWLCECECGKTATVESHKLRSGHTRSCGCLQVESIKTHGASRTRTYKIWAAMVQRATNPNNSGAEHYSKRGIGVCNEWLTFESFLADMGEAPPGMSIERKDNDKGYSKSNCVWATTAQQNRNRRWVRGQHPGVSQSPSGKKWHASITVNNMPIHLGSFNSYDEAIASRKTAERLLWN